MICLSALALQLICANVFTCDDASKDAARHERVHCSLTITIADEFEACSFEISFDDTEMCEHVERIRTESAIQTLRRQKRDQLLRDVLRGDA